MRKTRIVPTLIAALLAAVTLSTAAVAEDRSSGDARAGAGAAAERAEPKRQPIIGGHQADSGPWAARLFSAGRQTCSSTIIAPTWILTAKHCVSGGQLSFRIGSLDQTSGGTMANGTQVETHSADLALVKLDKEVEATYAKLGDPGSVQVGQNVQVYGWGATAQCQPEINCQSQFLKYANVTVTGGCTDAYGGNAICARRGDGITAGGDSGGPMMADGIQVGVASTSDRQTTTAYTNVTRYRDWIRSVAGV